MNGFGFSSRMTPGYAHATWDTMVAAVATLEEPLQFKQSVAVSGNAKSSLLRRHAVFDRFNSSHFDLHLDS